MHCALYDAFWAEDYEPFDKEKLPSNIHVES